MKKENAQSGNILFYILIAIALLGVITAVLRAPTSMEENIDREKASVLAGQILKQSTEIARGVQILIDNGVSESDIRFAHPKADSIYGTITTNPQNQVFSSQGGNATYIENPARPSSGTSVFGFAGDQAMPQAGSAKADLIGYVTNVSDPLCDAINNRLGIGTKPAIPTCAVSTAFTGTYASSPTALPTASFQTLPATQACVRCNNFSANSFMFTLIAR